MKKMSNKHKENIKRLGELIKGFPVAMLTTVDVEGRLRSRPMITQSVAFEGELWFLTRIHTQTVAEVKQDEQVNISYSSWEDKRFISISGTAKTVRDAQKMGQIWGQHHETWFPQGLNDPTVVLLKVNVEKAEYWDAERNVMEQLAWNLMSLSEPEKHEILNIKKATN